MNSPGTQRRNDLDWLRLIAITILLFFHTGMWFNTWDWHVKNAETSVTFNYWMVWLHQWRMPLLLFVSGAGTWLALGKRSTGQYVRERFKRLMIPLIFGMFIVVPPQIYYERINAYDGYWSFYKTVFNFVPYPEGSFSWHHLWFILYLFLYSMILVPFLKFLKSPGSENWRAKISSWLSSPGGMIWIPSIGIFLTQLLLRPFFPEEKHDLTDLAYFVFYGSFFFFGIVAFSDPRIWSSMELNRKKFLATALITLIPFYLVFLSFYGWIQLPWDGDTSDTVFDIISIFLSWFTVITVIAWGQRYLHKSHPWLSRINEGLYPFYILHQTVIIAIGYYICQLPWSITAKFITIVLLTGLTCWALIFLLIRPFAWLRLVFGMKLTARQNS